MRIRVRCVCVCGLDGGGSGALTLGGGSVCRWIVSLDSLAQDDEAGRKKRKEVCAARWGRKVMVAEMWAHSGTDTQRVVGVSCGRERVSYPGKDLASRSCLPR